MGSLINDVKVLDRGLELNYTEGPQSKEKMNRPYITSRHHEDGSQLIGDDSRKAFVIDTIIIEEGGQKLYRIL